MNVDDFLVQPRTKSYTCLHHTRDVWQAVTGVDITERWQGLLSASDPRQLLREHFAAFKRLPGLVDPCIVYMRQLGRDPHVGVYVQGGLLHLRARVPEFFPFELASRGFTSFRYYQ